MSPSKNPLDLQRRQRPGSIVSKTLDAATIETLRALDAQLDRATEDRRPRGDRLHLRKQAREVVESARSTLSKIEAPAPPPRATPSGNAPRARVVEAPKPRTPDPGLAIKGRDQLGADRAALRTLFASLHWERLTEGEAALVVRTYRNARPGLRNVMREDLGNLARRKAKRGDQSAATIEALLDVLSGRV